MGGETSMQSFGGLSYEPRPRDQTRTLGMYPDQESNPQPFGLWDNAPTNWAIAARAQIRIFKWITLLDQA